MWGATASGTQRCSHCCISIHAPRVGRDRGLGWGKPHSVVFQSTRPVWGATTRYCNYSKGKFDFNPRAPCGARPLNSFRNKCLFNFNPRAPCGARRKAGIIVEQVKEFQSTRPVWGATRKSNRSADWVYFNPRAPCGARRKLSGRRNSSEEISIHAPRVGRDLRGGRGSSPSNYFNPRAPCGARLGIFPVLASANMISIHAPRVGRDTTFHSHNTTSLNFNPRAPCGARPHYL